MVMDNHRRDLAAAQAALARIWGEVLGVARVGRDDDYFALGGDSILAIRVVALAKEAGLAITLPDLFAHPTLHRLAAALQVQGFQVFDSSWVLVAGIGRHRAIVVA